MPYQREVVLRVHRVGVVEVDVPGAGVRVVAVEESASRRARSEDPPGGAGTAGTG